MKLKLVIVLLLAAGLLFPSQAFATAKKANVSNSFIYQAIAKYRNKNYTGCIQDMDYAIQNGRPSDIAYYYKALSYAKLGMTDEAKGAYQSALSSTSNRTLAEYAQQAVSCIDDPTTCDSSLDDKDITSFIKSNQFMHPEVQQKVKDQAMDRIKQSINGEFTPDNNDLKYLNQNNAPTDKEIADAVRTFQKLGINPMNAIVGANYSAYTQNPEAMQINAMFGNQNNNNNNMMNLLPMMLAMQASPNGSGAINKEFLQTYMMNQMIPSFNFDNNDK